MLILSKCHLWVTYRLEPYFITEFLLLKSLDRKSINFSCWRFFSFVLCSLLLFNVEGGTNSAGHASLSRENQRLARDIGIQGLVLRSS